MSGQPKLLEPIKVGGVELKNRMVLLPMSTEGTSDYSIPKEIIDFYERIAKGGVGLIIVGSLMVTDFRGTKPAYDSTPHCPGIFSDELLPGLRNLVDAVHRHNCKISAQLELHYEWRTGPDAPIESCGPSVGPSAPHIPDMRPLTVDEIHKITEQYADAGKRAKEAGFDMIEVHSGIGYFLSRFLSSYSNKRTDDYGGTVQKRMRFLLEVIAAIREKVGPDYPITVRYSAEDFMPGGNTLKDAVQIAPELEKAGVCLLNIQAGFHESPKPLIQRWTKQGHFAYMGEAIKKVVKIPVIIGYRFVDPVISERVLSEGKADMIGMARALIADPELPNKVTQGRTEDVAQCICCCRCLDDVRAGKPVACSANGIINKPDLEPAKEKKKVMIIGGGPGGMEAARVAAIRGHKVVLYDMNPRLGGLTLLASVLNPEMRNWVKYLKRQVEKLPVEVHLKTKATAATIAKEKPDVVILGGGGAYPTLDVPGFDNPIVLNSHDIMDMANGRTVPKGFLWRMSSTFAPMFYSPALFDWALGLPWPIKKNVVVIGGGFAGCELGEVMAEKGRNVVILEKSGRIGEDIGITERWVVKINLKEHGVKTFTNTTVKEISSKGVVARMGDKEQLIPCDTVIVAEKLLPNTALYKEMETQGVKVYAIGDCADPARLREAVNSGFDIASKI